MYTRNSGYTTRANTAFALAIILAPASSFAADEGPVIMKPTDREQRQSIQEYWTPERMKNAIPKPFPALPQVMTNDQKEGVPASTGPQPDALPGLSPGWRPGGGPQPGPGALIELSPGDPVYASSTGGNQLQTSPPFAPPANPTDFGNYAPFNRFTWHGGNYLIYPISVVGKLFFTQNGQNFVCSASVINRSTLATAGHCVHAGSGGVAGWSSNLLFCPSFNPGGVNPARGCWSWLLIATSFQWFNAGNIDRDYGCIVTPAAGTLIANRVGNVTGWSGRAWNWPTRQSTIAWGYPAAAPFAGNRIVTAFSTEWYQLNRNASESQLSKYIGNDMTGGSSGGPWWISMVHNNLEYADTDGSNLTDPVQTAGFGKTPFINGVNSHKRCTQANCPAGSIFTQEMGSPQFRNTAADINESEDVFATCFNNGGTN